MFFLDLFCKNEKTVVGRVQTHGPLDARTITMGLHDQDYLRCPPPKKIEDAVQLFCEHCHGILYFRTATGELLAANPGTLTVEA